MKKIIYFTIILTFASCSGELVTLDEVRTFEKAEEVSPNETMPMTKSSEVNSDQSYDDSVYPYSREEDSLYIESLGWKISKIYEDSISYLINGELLFLKETLLSERNSIQSRLYGDKIHPDHQHILLNVNKYNNQNVSVPSYFSGAIEEWNSLIGCNLYFGITGQYSYDTNGWFEVTVEIGPDYNYNPDLINELEFGIMIVPLSSYEDNVPGNYMYINPNHDNFKSLSDSKKKYAVMHALGHLIRLQDADTSKDFIAGSEWNEKTVPMFEIQIKLE